MAGHLDRVVRIIVAVSLLLLGAQAPSEEPFGLQSLPTRSSSMAVTWQALQAEMAAERPLILSCRAERETCRSDAALLYLAIVDAGMEQTGLARIGYINRAANFAIGAGQNNADNRWTAPLAALAAGTGDCKQYSVLKYSALRDAGYAAADVRIIVLASRFTREAHAIAAVRYQGRWLMLDNRSLALVEGEEILKRYVPLYMLDDNGAREFAVPVAQRDRDAGCGLG